MAHPLAGGKQALADPERPPVSPTLGEATAMTFATDDFWIALRQVSDAELVRWWDQEPRPERRRLLEPLIMMRRLIR